MEGKDGVRRRGRVKRERVKYRASSAKRLVTGVKQFCTICIRAFCISTGLERVYQAIMYRYGSRIPGT